ncbi:rhamnosyltransferase [Companilactobacillus sp. RD055328]|uniref:glycosyltransferase family 2 protein n=1 Tax=Companilactobacillus sp. RD055328 TaxID=2916634 RepID=UPI001FC7F7DB|nr:glycosyltransferase family 2 protein [Companilactobacillus sp. RD055328]GKQ43153.1 rhamnosyltransferase [Companilactobacillus sp. RD055328]
MSPKVSIILLNYNNAEDTINCLVELRKITYDNYQIIIVDNNSTDNSLSKIESNVIDNEVVLKSTINGGYAFGNNIGIRFGMENNSDYFCILNNDVKVATTFLDELIAIMENNNEVGIAGPKICDFDQPDVIQSAGSIVNMNFGRATELYKGKNSEILSDKVINCDYVGGACMVVKKSVIAKIGLIPEDYFLFYEENEWCQKAKKNGFRIVSVGNSTVWHKGSHTINKISGLSEYFMYRNLVIFIKNNGTIVNNVIFNLYFVAFCFKSLLTKKNGSRFFKYYIDGITGHNQYEYLKK